MWCASLDPRRFCPRRSLVEYAGNLFRTIVLSGGAWRERTSLSAEYRLCWREALGVAVLTPAGYVLVLFCDADGSCQPCCPSTQNVDDDWHLSWISIPERRALCTSDDWIAIHCCGRGRTDAGLRKRVGRMPVSVCSPAKPFPPRKYHSLKNL